MNGDWAPEGEDLEEFPEGAEQLDAEAEGRLSAVTAYLASLPAPLLPEAVETRISAALAAEATARAGGNGETGVLSPARDAPGAAAPADGARTLRPAPARARVRRHRSGGTGHRAVRSRPLMVGSVIACLVLAGLGYGLSRGGPSGMSSPESSAFGAAAPSQAAAAPEASAPVPAASPSSGNIAAGLRFAVTTSGTKYQAATLAAQARANAAPVEGPGNPDPTPTAHDSVARRTATPDAALRGCVANVTGGRSPRLVDLATYQGKPAYIIISSTRVWVVGLGCTAGNPELIASAPLGP